MPESGQPTVDPGMLESIANHPSLQTTKEPDGTEVAREDPSSTHFLSTFGGQPAPAPETTPAAPESPQPTRLLAGKYKSVEEMERATIERERTLHEREAELRAARAVNQHLEEVFAPLRNQRDQPRERPVPVTFNDQQQPIVDNAALMEMVDRRAREIAREQVAETLQPLQSLSLANNRLRAEYPEIVQREGEFAQWLQANPSYQERVQRDPEFALEGAYLKFERDRGLATTTHNLETNTVAQAQVNQARSNASPAGGGATATRRPSESDAMQQRLTELYKLGNDTGNWKPYKDARTELAVGKQVLDSLNTTWGR